MKQFQAPISGQSFCSESWRRDDYRCTGHDPIEILGKALGSFETLSTAGTAPEIVRFGMLSLVILFKYLFSYNDACMKTSADKVMNYITIFVECLGW